MKLIGIVLVGIGLYCIFTHKNIVDIMKSHQKGTHIVLIFMGILLLISGINIKHIGNQVEKNKSNIYFLEEDCERIKGILFDTEDIRIILEDKNKDKDINKEPEKTSENIYNDFKGKVLPRIKSTGQSIKNSVTHGEIKNILNNIGQMFKR